jgi:predicted outer membrane protein
MNRFVTLSVLTVMTVAFVACSNGTSVSPSSLSGVAAPFGDRSTTGGRQVSGGVTSSVSADIVLSSGDNGFIAAAAASHQGQIQMAQLAEYNAAHPRVKWFARQMWEENLAGLRRLRVIGPNAVPQTITVNADHQGFLTELSALRAHPLDRRYTEVMLQQLPLQIAHYQQQAAGGSEPVLRESAADFAGRLSSYLEILREISARVH